MKLYERLLVVIRELATNRAITDTIWLPGEANLTACEELASIASELGATDASIELVFAPSSGQMSPLLYFSFEYSLPPLRTVYYSEMDVENQERAIECLRQHHPGCVIRRINGVPFNDPMKRNSR